MPGPIATGVTGNMIISQIEDPVMYLTGGGASESVTSEARTEKFPSRPHPVAEITPPS
jgi:hypothetical protein